MRTVTHEAGPSDEPAQAGLTTASRAKIALHLWRSPPGQPRWARPALLAVAGLAAFAYAWGDTSVNIETFYGAAVRSMSENWHNFFFASFDPWGTVSVDKLPGSLWLQALSLRIFGFHLWAILLPQVMEGTLTVLVLYRVVRRVAGPVAGLVAATALAVSPITVLTNRGNVSDTLLILLLVLAADAVTRAIDSGRWQTLVMAGLWVGLAFQAKMLEAWLVLPAFAIAYGLAAPALSIARRLGHIVLMGLAVLVVSLSWMTVVALVPAHDRPFVDGSCDNSIYSQVFLYNGADRVSGHSLDQPGCHTTSSSLLAAEEHVSASGFGQSVIPGGVGKFLTGALGRDDGWLFFPSMVAGAALFVLRRRQPRNDPRRAAAVMWLGWLFIMWSFFNASHALNSYYLVALVPPMAALCGMGVNEAAHLWTTSQRARPVVLGTAVLVALYGLTLVPASAGVRPWIIATTILALLAAMALVARPPARTVMGRRGNVGLAVCTIAVLLGPAGASATAVNDNLGTFSSPYQSHSVTRALVTSFDRAFAEAAALNREANRYPTTVAVDTRESSPEVSLEILLTGHEYLAAGGFSGRVPNPTLPQFVGDVSAGRVRRVLVATGPLTSSADLRWVRTHCAAQQRPVTIEGVINQRYLCSPADATHGP